MKRDGKRQGSAESILQAPKGSGWKDVSFAIHTQIYRLSALVSHLILLSPVSPLLISVPIAPATATDKASLYKVSLSSSTVSKLVEELYILETPKQNLCLEAGIKMNISFQSTNRNTLIYNSISLMAPLDLCCWLLFSCYHLTLTCSIHKNTFQMADCFFKKL